MLEELIDSGLLDLFLEANEPTEEDGPIQPGSGGYAWPLPGYTRISSPFAYRNCPYHGRELHGGIDLPAPRGTSILAAKAGVVMHLMETMLFCGTRMGRKRCMPTCLPGL